MSFKKLSESIPELYHRFLPEVFHLEIPPEPFADCSDCPLICSRTEEVGTDKAKPFSPEMKCCTFSPRIPNYMVGAILSDEDTNTIEGKERLLKIISSHQGVFPNGVYPTKKYKLLYEASCLDSFGRSELLKCPYFQSGEFNCTIWKYREAICALWFCKHLAGTTGFAFWNAIIEYMKFVQETLISYCFAQLDMPYSDPYGKEITMSYEDLEELPMKESVMQQNWNKWAGREVAFYKECYRIISEMNRETFETVMGIDQILLLKNITAVYNQMVELPEFMMRVEDGPLEMEGDSYIVELNHYIERIDSTIAYSFKLPVFIIDSFDGNTSTTEIIKKIYTEHSIVLEPEILIALYHHGVLVKK